MAADGGWWLCCGEPDAGFCGANGGSHGSNRSGALLVDFELVMMAAIVQEASGSTREALRGHEVTDTVRTSLTPRSQPTAALIKRHMPIHCRPFRRQSEWNGNLSHQRRPHRRCRSSKIRFALALYATDQDHPRLHSKLLCSCTHRAHRIYHAI